MNTPPLETPSPETRPPAGPGVPVPGARVRAARVHAPELLALGTIGALGVALALDPARIDDGPVLCPFRLLTGLECPACGLTRAWVHGVHGDLTASWAANPWGLPLLAALLVLGVVQLGRRLRHRPPVMLERVARHPVTLALAAGWALWGILRMLS